MSSEKPPYLVQYAHGVLTASDNPGETFSAPLPSFNPLPDQLPLNPFEGDAPTAPEAPETSQGEETPGTGTETPPEDPNASNDVEGASATATDDSTGTDQTDGAAADAPAADAPAADAPAADAPAADAPAADADATDGKAAKAKK